MNKEWKGYCRTYLTRYGITDKVAILAIAGNLEQVVLKLLKEERERILGEVRKCVEGIDFYGWDANTQRMIREKVLRILEEKENRPTP